jgi:hypothetical protein
MTSTQMSGRMTDPPAAMAMNPPLAPMSSSPEPLVGAVVVLVALPFTLAYTGREVVAAPALL